MTIGDGVWLLLHKTRVDNTIHTSSQREEIENLVHFAHSSLQDILTSVHPYDPQKLTEKAGPRDNTGTTATGAAESEIKAEANREARPSMTHHQSHHTGRRNYLLLCQSHLAPPLQIFTEFSLKMHNPAFQVACSFSCIAVLNLKINLNQSQVKVNFNAIHA